MSMEPNEASFEELQGAKNKSLVGEMVGFIMANKAWWMIPIVVVLGFVSLLAVAAGTGAAPFIYTMF